MAETLVNGMFPAVAQDQCKYQRHISSVTSEEPKNEDKIQRTRGIHSMKQNPISFDGHRVKESVESLEIEKGKKQRDRLNETRRVMTRYSES